MQDTRACAASRHCGRAGLRSSATPSRLRTSAAIAGGADLASSLYNLAKLYDVVGNRIGRPFEVEELAAFQIVVEDRLVRKIADQPLHRDTLPETIETPDGRLP